MNTKFKGIVFICLSIVVLLSGCTINFESKESDYRGEISLSDIELFYEDNTEFLNKATKEYISINPDNDYINIFYDEYNQLKIWDATNQIDLIHEKEDYSCCINIVSLMSDFMLVHGFETPKTDYSVRISPYEFDSEYADDGNKCHAVLFEFTAYDINIEERFYLSSFSVATIDNTVYYRLFYSELEIPEFEKIADNWYIEEWHHI